VRKATLISLALLLSANYGPLAAAQRPRICEDKNGALIQAIRIIDRACNDIDCNFSTLRELNFRIEKEALLAAFRNPDLQSVHIFFPVSKSDETDILDWNASKRSQLNSIKYAAGLEDSVIFVLGRASAIGDIDTNIRLSRARMQTVMRYLKYDLHLNCRGFRGGWFGREILQLTKSDAAMLQIDSQDFRDDEDILNQSVHIFVFPCGGLL